MVSMTNKITENEKRALELKHQQTLTTYQFLWISILAVSLTTIVGAITGVINIAGIVSWVIILIVVFVNVLFYIFSNMVFVKKMNDIQEKIAGKKIEKIIASSIFFQNISSQSIPTGTDSITTAVGLIVMFGIIFVLAKLLSK